MSVVEESKKLYWPFLDEEDRAKVEALDVPDQAYFWTYIYHELPRQIGRSVLEGMERDVVSGKAIMRPVIRASIRQAVKVDDMWETTKPHSWFKAIVD